MTGEGTLGRGPSEGAAIVGGGASTAEPAVLGFFWGDDGYGLERSADRLAERLAVLGGVPAERRRVSGAEAAPDQLLEWVATAPLFGGGTLVTVVDPVPLVRSREALAAVVEVLGRIAPGNGLAFLAPIDGSSGKPPLALDKLRAAVAAAGGETAELKAPTEGRLAAWIQSRAAERGLDLGRGTAQELGTRIGGFVREGDVDRRRMGILAVSELEKLALYRPGAQIGVDDVRALVPEAVPASSWAFLDAVGNRRVSVAAGLLPRILDSTPEPVLVAQLHRRLRELIEVADHLAAGATPASLVRTLGQKPFRVDKLVEQARRWTPTELEAALEGVFEMDLRIKGVGPTTEAQRRLAVTLWLVERVGGGSLAARR
jgi:DNA polymerase III delta subunit